MALPAEKIYDEDIASSDEVSSTDEQEPDSKNLISHKEFKQYGMIIRLEEELKHQRNLMTATLEFAKQSSTEQREDMNKRFEKVDQRFVEQREDMNKRFEKVDQRFVEQRI